MILNIWYFKGCGSTSLTNGAVKYVNGTFYTSVAKLKCSDGYQLNGTDTVTCLENGEWDMTSYCIIRGTSAFVYIPSINHFYIDKSHL